MTERYVVPGVDRALTVLELLAQQPEGLSMIEIAARTGFPNNSVYRIAMTLCRRGYLRRSAETKRFTITRKFLKLAFPSVHHLNIVEVSMDVMEELRDEVGESVFLAVFTKSAGDKTQGEGVVLAQSPALHPIRLMVEPGTRFDLYSTGPGKAMLAFLPDKQQARLIESFDYKPHTRNTITDAATLRKELTEIRHLGYGLDRGESFEGVHCVGSPLFDEHGAVLGAIWVSGPSTRLPETEFERIGLDVVSSAKRISQRIGYYGERGDDRNVE